MSKKLIKGDYIEVDFKDNVKMKELYGVLFYKVVEIGKKMLGTKIERTDGVELIVIGSHNPKAIGMVFTDNMENLLKEMEDGVVKRVNHHRGRELEEQYKGGK